jgi:hypothetical protein
MYGQEKAQSNYESKMGTNSPYLTLVLYLHESIALRAAINIIITIILVILCAEYLQLYT